MPLNRSRCQPLLQSFDFKKLFIEELGWDKHTATLDVPLKTGAARLDAIAHKRGFVAWHCLPDSQGRMPDSAARRKIEREVTKSSYEHFIVFTDGTKSRQLWQWVRREQGRPLRVREFEFAKNQSGAAILQKLDPLFVSLDDEETIDLTAIATRAAANVSERVTRRFYEDFKRQHTGFLKFIKGIPNQGDHEWYASVMLNRLMFIYFIQKKGFLDGDTDYLRNRLNELKSARKTDKFYSFYREFLLRLFHEGLGSRARNKDLQALVGNVPYLNGGIFDVHEIEKKYGKEIAIPDKAFEDIFDYFDRYHWHLDERPLRADNEINPDVLGYIFEKYINQKQMGAYYTKEDITEYIGKSCIVPFLFDSARAKCKVAFEGKDTPTVWDLLRENPDKYIYQAVRHGCECELPKEIARGLDTSKPDLIGHRKGWNQAAPAEFSLPTETWREVVARRQRCEEIRRKLAAGEVREINDLVTLNLDLRQFAQDVIDTCEGPDLLFAFWQAVSTITVLDPTGGSGAFLFAALNILQPLYEACLDRMQGFMDEWGDSGKKSHPNYHKKFTEILENVAAHPNRRYFVLKSIILNNLYAVDIMEEAIEICKLRLFLKLAALVDPDAARANYGIEPLPDIDFNIRCGNTLVGYATEHEVKKAIHGDVQGTFDLHDDWPKIKEALADVQQTFDAFRAAQLSSGSPPAEHKKELQRRLADLRNELDRCLAGDYGIPSKNKEAFLKWKISHQPFHWFVEFYGILNFGGFDVVIGNPPYVSAAKVRRTYIVKNFETLSCSDIYAWILERTQTLLCDGGRTGMIVPLSLGFSADFDVCRRLLGRSYGGNWFSSFGRIPAALFNFDVRVRNTIHIGYKTKAEIGSYTTRLHRWFEAARSALFQCLEFAPYQPTLWKNRIPKLNSSCLSHAFERALGNSPPLDASTSKQPTRHVLHFKNSAYNWLNFCRSLPPCFEGNRQVPHTMFGDVYFSDEPTSQLALLLANGKLMMIFWFAIGDDFHVTRWNFAEFPAHIAAMPKAERQTLLAISKRLETAMKQNVQFKLNAGRKVGNYNLAKCRDITDESDAIFARLLGLGDALQDIELYYAQTMKTDFSEEAE